MTNGFLYPKIDVRIPYEPNGRLGEDYNRVMQETVHDWVLFIDHDILLNTNPHWYHICQTVIKEHPKTGMFTCRTNVHHKTAQYDPSSPQNNDSIDVHQDHARKIFDEIGYRCSRIGAPRMHVSGFFMLISKSAWSSVGGFPGKGMFKEDWEFSKRLEKKGIPVMLIEGLYVYHMRKRMDSWIIGVNGTKEMNVIEKSQ